MRARKKNEKSEPLCDVCGSGLQNDTVGFNGEPKKV